MKGSRTICKSLGCLVFFSWIALGFSAEAMQNEQAEVSPAVAKFEIRSLQREASLDEIRRGNELMFEYLWGTYDEAEFARLNYWVEQKITKGISVKDMQKEVEEERQMEAKCILVSWLFDDSEAEEIFERMYGNKDINQFVLRSPWFGRLREKDQLAVKHAKELANQCFWEQYAQDFEKYTKEILSDLSHTQVTVEIPTCNIVETYFPDHTTLRSVQGKESPLEQSNQEDEENFKDSALRSLKNGHINLTDAKQTFLSVLLDDAEVFFVKEEQNVVFRLRSKSTLGMKYPEIDTGTPSIGRYFLKLSTMKPYETNVGVIFRELSDYPLYFLDIKNPRQTKSDFALRPLFPFHAPLQQRDGYCLYDAMKDSFQSEQKKLEKFPQDIAQYSMGTQGFPVISSDLHDLLKLNGMLLDILNNTRPFIPKKQKNALRSLSSEIDKILTDVKDTKLSGLKEETQSLLREVKKISEQAKRSTEPVIQIPLEPLTPNAFLAAQPLSKVWMEFVRPYLKNEEFSRYNLDRIMEYNYSLQLPKSMPEGFNVSVLRYFINPNSKDPTIQTITNGFLAHIEKHFTLGLSLRETNFSSRSCIHTCLNGKGKFTGRVLSVRVLKKIMEKANFSFEKMSRGFCIRMDSLISEKDVKYILSDVQSVTVFHGEPGDSIKTKKNYIMKNISDIDDFQDWKFYFIFALSPYETITMEELQTGKLGTFFLEAPLKVRLELRQSSEKK